MAVLSVDLAYKSYADIGAVVLKQTDKVIRCNQIRLPSDDPPSPKKLAEFLHAICLRNAIRLLMLDGPQAWKADDNGLMHSRLCERELNTPAKTGKPFVVKPANYAPFVQFSIEVYDALGCLGWDRLSDLRSASESPDRILIETFPLSAWRTLGIRPLPSKRRCRITDLTTCVSGLLRLFPLRLPDSMNHDEVQATVAGLAGLAIESGEWRNCKAAGVPPKQADGYWREGLILNLNRPS